MNKDRRKAIDLLIVRICELDGLRESLREDIQSVLDEEQEYFDNMPESLQGGDKGTVAEEAIAQLQEAVDFLEAIDVDELTTFLTSAQEG